MKAGPAAMVRPVRPWPYRFFRVKMNGVAWILTYACGIESPLRAVHCSLECLNYGEVFFGLSKSSSITSSDERIEASQFSMAILEHVTSTQIGGEANMRVVRGGHFCQLGSQSQCSVV